MIRGSCLCGGVRFEYARAVSEVGMCHCSLCRKVSGAASNAVIVVPEADLRWLGGEDLRRVFVKPSGWKTTFCSRCGSPLPQTLREAAAYWVPAGLLDDDPGLPVGGHIFVGSKAPWDEIGGDAPQFQERLPGGRAEVGSRTTSVEAGVQIRELVASDLDAALELWSRTEGLGLNESDTREALQAFLRRNPGFSAVATSLDGTLVGAVLCGHDGRRATIHHLAVAKPSRRQGTARQLLAHCLARLEQARIPRCNVFLYDDNMEGMKFWAHNGWEGARTWRTLQRRVG